MYSEYLARVRGGWWAQQRDGFRVRLMAYSHLLGAQKEVEAERCS